LERKEEAREAKMERKAEKHQRLYDSYPDYSQEFDHRGEYFNHPTLQHDLEISDSDHDHHFDYHEYLQK